MQRVTIFALAAIISAAGSASAEFRLKEIDEGLYFGEFKASEWIQGRFFLDTEKKNARRLLRGLRSACREKGYAFLHVVTLKEIDEDAVLKAQWARYAGSGETTKEPIYMGVHQVGTTPVVKRLVRFSSEEQPRFERCGKK